MQSQNQQILEHLKSGKGITPLDALQSYGSFRLSARIYELKEKGWPIESKRIDVGDGRNIAHYSLVNDKDMWPED